MALVNGVKLNEKLQKQVLNAFIYRWTIENRTRAISAYHHNPPTMPLITDAQWLKAHDFYVNKNGDLAKRPACCEPHYD